ASLWRPLVAHVLPRVARRRPRRSRASVRILLPCIHTVRKAALRYRFLVSPQWSACISGQALLVSLMCGFLQRWFLRHSSAAFSVLEYIHPVSLMLAPHRHVSTHCSLIVTLQKVCAVVEPIHVDTHAGV